MPELPEVRAHAERLTEAFAGAQLIGFRPLSFTALKTATPDPKHAVGEALTTVATRGKVLLLRFASVTFAVHLMQGGRLNVDTKQSARPRGGLARWTFDDHPALLLTEAGTEHKAGVWVLEPDDHEGGPLAELGPDADAISAAQFEAILSAAGGSRLHGVLRDQRRLAGLGRRLANEICWAAQLSPFAPAGKLAVAERERLFAAMVSTVEASLADERSRSEMVKSAQRLAHVHHRAGQPCSRCGDTLRQVEYRAYEVDYCPTCQTGGKVLADNTTSKFLK
jgi:formamidopyrimidine-DNA glycosylase